MSTRADGEAPGDVLYRKLAPAWYNTAEIVTFKRAVSTVPAVVRANKEGGMIMRSLRLGLLIAVVATLLIAVPGAASEASPQTSHSAGSSLTLSGPKSNTTGADFDYTISGTAIRPADYVVA